jgi:hypothetical protein
MYQSILHVTAAWYQKIFAADVSEEEVHVVAQQIDEAKKQRNKRQEELDKLALGLRLRARPVVIQASAMLQGANNSSRDPRRRQRSPERVGEAAKQQQQAAASGLQPSVSAGGVVRLPLPVFARTQAYLGGEIFGALQQRWHEAAIGEAREQVLKERPRLLQDVRAGKQVSTSSSQQQQQSTPPPPPPQQQPEEGEVAELQAPFRGAALGLEDPNKDWELVCLRGGGESRSDKNIRTVCPRKEWLSQ